MEFSKKNDGWHFLFVEGMLGLVKIDFRLTLVVSDRSETIEICIETPFTITDSGADFACVPENPVSLGPILSLVNSQVDFIEATTSGELSVRFATGATINVAPDPSFEAWQLATSTELLIVCPPEGRVVLFEKGH
jgi:Family of unknown function (DUF6188)